ncbi:hypothetical protein [Legionella tunisiensis]|uniref:hypothetical protein n=1 Tax=Legionella tunisiensis TaxID=1034944 RepID=UPI000315FAF4|nr:hypothetical protein [Legionella tunisiensis]
MGKNFKIGLQKLLHSSFNAPEISVLSIGCGNNFSVILDEIKILIAISDSTKINYTDLDLKLNNAEQLTDPLT